MSNTKKPISYWTAIEENKRKTFIFLILLFLLYASFVGIVAYLIDPDLVIPCVLILTLFYIFYAYLNYRFGYVWIISSVGAEPIENYNDEYKKKLVLDVVKEIWDASGLGLQYPYPKVYFIRSNDINAFATGPSPKKAVICLTTGAIEKLERFELEGIIAHEISHIGNLDIRTMTVVITVGSLILTIAAFCRESWRLLYLSDDDSKEKGRLLGIVLVLVILGFVVDLLARFLMSLISKEREFLADATAVKILNTPRGLISAFEKIKKEIEVGNSISFDDSFNDFDDPEYLEEPPKRVRMLFFHCELFEDVFSTHPSLDERIKRLKSMF
jgi:heat shock protein HtpX